MPTYIWKNKETGEIKEITCLIRDRDTPPEEEGEWERTLQAPMVMSASYPDGVRAASDPTYQKLTRASKLEVKFAESESKTERAEIRKEINTLTKA